MGCLMFLLTVLILAVFPATLQATVIHVPGDRPNIQSGINACVDGDTVLIADGTYVGQGNRNITFDGKAITVKSESGNPYACIIDLMDILDNRGFNFNTNEGSESVLEGVTIANGYVGNFGGAIFCDSFSGPTIRGNVFTSNYASRGGGAICCWDSSGAIITNNTFASNYSPDTGGAIRCYRSSNTLITDNTFTSNSSYSGGAIAYEDSDSIIIMGNTFTSNSATVYSGGAIYHHSSKAIIVGNTFTSNRAGYGGAIHVLYGSCTITGNTFTSNSAIREGGAIKCKADPTITNNTFTSNSAEQTGGAIDFSRFSRPTITNNTFASNSSARGGALCLHATDPELVIVNNTFYNNTASSTGGAISSHDSSPTIVNTILWNDSPNEIYNDGSGNPIVTYSDVQGGWSGTSNIDANPLFVDPDNSDYHLSDDSPCVDSGTDAGVYDDFEGDARPVGYGFDMGVDESPYSIALNLSFTPGDSLTVPPGGIHDFRTLIQNNTDNSVAGDYWLSVMLPDSNEIVVPEGFLNYANPLNGQVPANLFLELFNEADIPGNAPVGSYEMIGRVGVYPNTVIDEESFSFQVIE